MPIASRPLSIPGASRQVAFHQLLVAARKTWLVDGLKEAVLRVDPQELKKQIGEYVPSDAQQLLAANAVRDEYVFPTPVVLEAAPTLIGYYRLLLGIPQKGFYHGSTGMARFKSMERHGTINERQREGLPEFCSAMGSALADMVRQLSPAVTSRDIAELPLLTLGQQLQGANNVRIGQQAILDIFLTIAEIVQPYLSKREDRLLGLVNSSGRSVLITLAADPDVRIEEVFGDERRKKVAIEIKGGTDRSNAHNRAGEAEKSHQKARLQGFRDFWTIIALKDLDLEKLRRESPTTNSWFDVAEVLAREGLCWEEFRSRLAGEVGIPL